MLKECQFNTCYRRELFRKRASKNLLFAMGPLQNILAVLILTRRMIYNKINSWKICCFLLLKVICLFLLWIVSG
jgi:hypothetical protein